MMSPKTEAHYRLPEGQIWLPAETSDHSVNVFVSHQPEDPLNMNISRDQLAEKEGLSDYVLRQLGLLKKNFRHYTLQQHVCFYLGQQQLRTEQLEASYQLDKQRVYQIQAAVELAGGKIMIFTTTCAAPFTVLQRELWTRWLNSFELTDPLIIK